MDIGTFLRFAEAIHAIFAWCLTSPMDDYRRFSERQRREANWQEFLRLGAEPRARGGHELEIPRRTSRPDPFRRQGRRG